MVFIQPIGLEDVGGVGAPDVDTIVEMSTNPGQDRMLQIVNEQDFGPTSDTVLALISGSITPVTAAVNTLLGRGVFGDLGFQTGGPSGTILPILATGPSAGLFLEGNGTWSVPPLGAVSLDDLGDVDLTALPAPALGDLLTFDGTLWRHSPAAGGGVQFLSDLLDVFVNTPPGFPGNDTPTGAYVRYNLGWQEAGLTILDDDMPLLGGALNVGSFRIFTNVATEDLLISAEGDVNADVVITGGGGAAELRINHSQPGIGNWNLTYAGIPVIALSGALPPGDATNRRLPEFFDVTGGRVQISHLFLDDSPVTVTTGDFVNIASAAPGASPVHVQGVDVNALQADFFDHETATAPHDQHAHLTRDALTRIDLNELASGTPGATFFLNANGSWAVPAGSGGGADNRLEDVSSSGDGSILGWTAVHQGGSLLQLHSLRIPVRSQGLLAISLTGDPGPPDLQELSIDFDIRGRATALFVGPGDSVVISNASGGNTNARLFLDSFIQQLTAPVDFGIPFFEPLAGGVPTFRPAILTFNTDLNNVLGTVTGDIDIAPDSGNVFINGLAVFDVNITGDLPGAIIIREEFEWQDLAGVPQPGWVLTLELIGSFHLPRWAAPTGGGTGDVVGPGATVTGEIAVWFDTGGLQMANSDLVFSDIGGPNSAQISTTDGNGLQLSSDTGFVNLSGGNVTVNNEPILRGPTSGTGDTNEIVVFAGGSPIEQTLAVAGITANQGLLSASGGLALRLGGASAVRLQPGIPLSSADTGSPNNLELRAHDGVNDNNGVINVEGASFLWNGVQVGTVTGPGTAATGVLCSFFADDPAQIAESPLIALSGGGVTTLQSTVLNDDLDLISNGTGAVLINGGTPATGPGASTITNAVPVFLDTGGQAFAESDLRIQRAGVTVTLDLLDTATILDLVATTVTINQNPIGDVTHSGGAVSLRSIPQHVNVNGLQLGGSGIRFNGDTAPGFATLSPTGAHVLILDGTLNSGLGLELIGAQPSSLVTFSGAVPQIDGGLGSVGGEMWIREGPDVSNADEWVVLPIGTAGQLLTAVTVNNNVHPEWVDAPPGGTGDVSGPGPDSTDIGRIAVWNSTEGILLRNSQLSLNGSIIAAETGSTLVLTGSADPASIDIESRTTGLVRIGDLTGGGATDSVHLVVNPTSNLLQWGDPNAGAGSPTAFREVLRGPTGIPSNQELVTWGLTAGVVLASSDVTVVDKVFTGISVGVMSFVPNGASNIDLLGSGIGAVRIRGSAPTLAGLSSGGSADFIVENLDTDQDLILRAVSSAGQANVRIIPGGGVAPLGEVSIELDGTISLLRITPTDDSKITNSIRLVSNEALTLTSGDFGGGAGGSHPIYFRPSVDFGANDEFMSLNYDAGAGPPGEFTLATGGTAVNISVNCVASGTGVWNFDALSIGGDVFDPTGGSDGQYLRQTGTVFVAADLDLSDDLNPTIDGDITITSIGDFMQLDVLTGPSGTPPAYEIRSAAGAGAGLVLSIEQDNSVSAESAGQHVRIAQGTSLSSPVVGGATNDSNLALLRNDNGGNGILVVGASGQIATFDSGNLFLLPGFVTSEGGTLVVSEVQVRGNLVLDHHALGGPEVMINCDTGGNTTPLDISAGNRDAQLLLRGVFSTAAAPTTNEIRIRAGLSAATGFPGNIIIDPSNDTSPDLDEDEGDGSDVGVLNITTGSNAACDALVDGMTILRGVRQDAPPSGDPDDRKFESIRWFCTLARYKEWFFWEPSANSDAGRWLSETTYNYEFGRGNQTGNGLYCNTIGGQSFDTGVGNFAEGGGVTISQSVTVVRWAGNSGTDTGTATNAGTWTLRHCPFNGASVVVGPGHTVVAADRCWEDEDLDFEIDVTDPSDGTTHRKMGIEWNAAVTGAFPGRHTFNVLYRRRFNPV